jgi:hypothetical protein
MLVWCYCCKYIKVWCKLILSSQSSLSSCMVMYFFYSVCLLHPYSATFFVPSSDQFLFTKFIRTIPIKSFTYKITSHARISKALHSSPLNAITTSNIKIQYQRRKQLDKSDIMHAGRSVLQSRLNWHSLEWLQGWIGSGGNVYFWHKSCSTKTFTIHYFKFLLPVSWKFCSCVECILQIGLV